jgi:hypothetical protein
MTLVGGQSNAASAMFYISSFRLIGSEEEELTLRLQNQSIPLP